MKSPGQRFHFSIGDSNALMLAEVLGPALDHEGLEKPSWLGCIFVETPANGSIAPADLPYRFHGVRELLSAGRVDQVFDCY